MFHEAKAFNGSSGDLARARDFYANTLGLDVTMLDEGNGPMQLNLAWDGSVRAYVPWSAA